MKITTTQHAYKNFASRTQYRHYYTDLITRHKTSKIFVLPEYVGLELQKFGDVEFFKDVFSGISKHTGVYILAGTILEKHGKYYRNRSYFFTPGGYYAQDKLQLTAYEKKLGYIKPGESLALIKTPFANIGINICYDAEFPAYANLLAQKGADLLLVPSCTETVQGFNRVNICARARAVECQMVVVTSCSVGEVKWSPIIDKNSGKAGIYEPIDVGCQPDGIVAEGKYNRPQVITADVNFKKLPRVRQKGAVANFLDHQKLKTLPLIENFTCN